jgi:hypothetical protein
MGDGVWAKNSIDGSFSMISAEESMRETLARLQTLVVPDTGVTGAGVADLQKALPKLMILN